MVPTTTQVTRGSVEDWGAEQKDGFEIVYTPEDKTDQRKEERRKATEHKKNMKDYLYELEKYQEYLKKIGRDPRKTK